MHHPLRWIRFHKLFPMSDKQNLILDPMVHSLPCAEGDLSGFARLLEERGWFNGNR